MATLRQFVLAQSTLPTGNTVRDHIQNPGTGGGGINVSIGAILSGTILASLTANIQELTLTASDLTTLAASISQEVLTGTIKETLEASNGC